MFIIQLKLIWAIIRNNLFSNIGLSLLYSFLFVIIFGVVFIFSFVQSFFSNNYTKNFLEIEASRVKNEQYLDYGFVDSFKKEFPDAKVYSNFLLRMPTMMKISFFGNTFETDTFLMGFDPEYVRIKGYQSIENNNTSNNAIGLSLSNETLLVLKNFLFPNASAETLQLLQGELVFGRSSLFRSVGGLQEEKRDFYIEGISNALPIYAIAMDVNEALKISKRFGINRNDIRLHKVHILLKTKKDKELYQYFISKYNKNNNKDFIVHDSSRQVQEFKNKYEFIIYAFLAIFSFFLSICIVVITELSLQNLIYKSREMIKVALYSQISRGKILYLFGFVFVFIFGICFFILVTLYTIVSIFSAKLLSYIGPYISHFHGVFQNSLSIFGIIAFLFCMYYIISLFKKILFVKL